MPRVTVIIATYNWSSVLPYSIGSVLRQTFTDFELLVIGDGCTDDSEQVVTAIDDERVQWINLPENTRHQSGPNNEGLRRARGELIAYLGHDDLWLPHHLEAAVKALDADGADFSYSMVANVADGGKFIWPSIPRPDAGTFCSPLGIVHRKRVTDQIGGWRHHTEVRNGPDAELWQRMQAAGYKSTFVPRLTGVKFSAAERRNVYVTRPCHEQALWSELIQSQPDFELRQLTNFIAGTAVPNGMPYRELLRQFVRQTAARFRQRWFVAGSWRGKGERFDLESIRRFKGL